MSTEPTPGLAPTPAVPKPLRVLGHTGLIYWWPVWLVGFILAGLTYAEGSRLTVVPPGTTVTTNKDKTVYELKVNRPAPNLDQAVAYTADGAPAFPTAIASRKGYGLIWFAVILLVVFGSNVPLRGLATVVVLLGLVLLVMVFAFLEMWTPILEFLGGMHIQITVAGYLVPSCALLILWLATMFLYDPLRYALFTPGQLSLVRNIGDHIEVHPAAAIRVEKRPDDLLRHWILGLGAGDLIITVPGRGDQIEFPNVLFINSKLAQIAVLMNLKPVVTKTGS
jgi:hypothetical protein